MIASDAIREFIRGWEKCCLVRYNDSAGKATIGVGHLLPLNDTRQVISQDKADVMFVQDVDVRANALCMFITCNPTQQQFDAVLSLAYNEGIQAIGHSTLMRNLNMGLVNDVAYQFGKWVYSTNPATGQLVRNEGLVKRRVAEQRIFMDGVYDSSH